MCAEFPQLRLKNESDAARFDSTGSTQQVSVCCAVAGVLLFRQRGRALRPGVEPGCTPTDARLVGGYRDSFPSCWGHPEQPRCAGTVTFLSRLALQGVVRVAVATPVAQPDNIGGWAIVLGSCDHNTTVSGVVRLIGMRLGYNIYGLDTR